MKLSIINNIKEFKEAIKKKHITVFYFYSEKFEELNIRINNINLDKDIGKKLFILSLLFNN